MKHYVSSRVRSQIRDAVPSAGRQGLSVGTIIYTSDGALPVEFLNEGDRIVTRAGMRVLRGIKASLGIFHLEFDAPEVVYADGCEYATA